MLKALPLDNLTSTKTPGDHKSKCHSVSRTEKENFGTEQDPLTDNRSFCGKLFFDEEEEASMMKCEFLFVQHRLIPLTGNNTKTPTVVSSTRGGLQSDND